jgi:hypothetical protein
MTPQEKAKELLLKFMAIQFGDFPTTDAKKCALICIDEIINARPLDPNYVDWDDCGAAHQYWYEAQKEEALEFWNNVKSELQSF